MLVTEHFGDMLKEMGKCQFIYTAFMVNKAV